MKSFFVSFFITSYLGGFHLHLFHIKVPVDFFYPFWLDPGDYSYRTVNKHAVSQNKIQDSN